MSQTIHKEQRNKISKNNLNIKEIKAEISDSFSN
mgnify:CR=1 FL=1